LLRSRFADEPLPRWGVVEVLTLFGIFFFGAWSIRQQEFGFAWIEWLRQNFFIFTREPLLQVYVHIFSETFVLKLGTVLFILFYLWARGLPVARSLGLARPAQNYSARFLTVFFVLCAAVAWWEGLDPLVPDLPTPLFFRQSATLGNVLAVLSLAVIAPVTEEIIFRGFVYPALTPRFGRWGAVLLTSLMFTAAHAPQMNGAYGSLGVIFIVGTILTWQRALTGSTLFVIGLHALYNASLTAAGLIRFCFYGF